MVSRVRNVARNFQVGPNKTKENISENGYRRTKGKAFLVINGKPTTKEYYSAITSNTLLIHTENWMTLQRIIMLSEKSDMLYDSTYITFLK